MKSTKVSIITPIYNGAEYIERFYKTLNCIEWDNLQFIWVNDGSTDESHLLVEKLCEKDNRITYINKSQNEGVSKARNDALAVADGEYVFFFDCDDTVNPLIVKKCVNFATANKYDAVLYIVNNVTADQKVQPFDFRYEKDEYIGEEVIEVVEKSLGITTKELKEFLRGKCRAHEGKQRNGPWRMMYRNAVLKEYHLLFPQNIGIGEDTVFTNEYLCYCQKVGVIRECLYYVWINESSTIHTYLKNVQRMVSEKKKIVDEKIKMTRRVKEIMGYDISACWGGEVLLSSVQLALALVSDDSIKFIEKVRKLKEYHYNCNVREIWKRVNIRELLGCFSIRVIPVIMLKLNMNVLLLLMLMGMKKCHINISV